MDVYSRYVKIQRSLIKSEQWQGTFKKYIFLYHLRLINFSNKWFRFLNYPTSTCSNLCCELCLIWIIKKYLLNLLLLVLEFRSVYSAHSIFKRLSGYVGLNAKKNILTNIKFLVFQKKILKKPEPHDPLSPDLAGFHVQYQCVQEGLAKHYDYKIRS